MIRRSKILLQSVKTFSAKSRISFKTADCKDLDREKKVTWGTNDIKRFAGTHSATNYTKIMLHDLPKQRTQHSPLMVGSFYGSLTYLALTTYLIKKLLYFNYNGIGPWCGQVVSVLAFYSENPSSNRAEAYSFSVRLCLKRTKINKKEAGGLSTLKINSII